MRQINPDKVAPWFNPWKLKAMFMYKGYENYGAPISKVLGVSESTARDKISLSRLSHEETIALARFLEMTPQDYCEVFLKDLFEPKNGD